MVYGACVLEIAVITSFVLTVIALDASAICLYTLVILVVGEVKLWRNVLGVVMLFDIDLGSVACGVAGFDLVACLA